MPNPSAAAAEKKELRQGSGVNFQISTSFSAQLWSYTMVRVLKSDVEILMVKYQHPLQKMKAALLLCNSTETENESIPYQKVSTLLWDVYI